MYIDDEDIKISLRAHAGIIVDGHPIASYLGGSFCGGCEEALAGAIRDKGAKYGQLDRPYIVCVNMIGVRHPRTDEIHNTLFGLRWHLTDTYNYQSAPFSIEMDGVLKNPTGPIFTQVSAFFITQVFPSNLHVAKHRLIEHPATKNKIDLGKLDLTNHNESSIRTKKSIKEIFISIYSRATF